MRNSTLLPPYCCHPPSCTADEQLGGGHRGASWCPLKACALGDHIGCIYRSAGLDMDEMLANSHIWISEWHQCVPSTFPPISRCSTITSQPITGWKKVNECVVPHVYCLRAWMALCQFIFQEPNLVPNSSRHWARFPWRDLFCVMIINAYCTVLIHSIV